MAGTGPRTTNLPVKSLYVSKAFFKGKYEAKLEFPGGGEFKPRKLFMGEALTFPRTTHLHRGVVRDNVEQSLSEVQCTNHYTTLSPPLMERFH